MLESALTVQPSSQQTTTQQPVQNKNQQQFASRPTASNSVQQSSNNNQNRVSTNNGNNKQQFGNISRGVIPPKNGVSCPNAYARAVAVSHPNPMKIGKNSSSITNLSTDDLKCGAAARRANNNFECVADDNNHFRATAQRIRSSVAVIAGGGQDHRRNSLDTFSTGKLLMTKTTSSGVGVSEPIAVEHQRRRQSLIDADPPPVKQIREANQSIRLVPSMSKHKLMSVLNARAKVTVGPLKPARSSILCFKATSPTHHQSPSPLSRTDGPPPRTSSEDSQHFDSRLRQLEEKVRKHNQSINNHQQATDQLKSATTTRHQRALHHLPSHSDPTVASSIIERHPHPLHLSRTLSGMNNNNASKQQQQQQQQRPNRIINRYQLTDIGGSGDHAGQTRYGHNQNQQQTIQQHTHHHHHRLTNNGNNSSNYSVVRATDFFKLRSSEVTS